MKNKSIPTFDIYKKLESAILDGFGPGVWFTREEAQKLRALAEYCARGYMGPHAGTVEMIRRKVPQ